MKLSSRKVRPRMARNCYKLLVVIRNLCDTHELKFGEKEKSRKFQPTKIVRRVKNALK